MSHSLSPYNSFSKYSCQFLRYPNNKQTKKQTDKLTYIYIRTKTTPGFASSLDVYLFVPPIAFGPSINKVIKSKECIFRNILLLKGQYIIYVTVYVSNSSFKVLYMSDGNVENARSNSRFYTMKYEYIQPLSSICMASIGVIFSTATIQYHAVHYITQKQAQDLT